MNFKNTGWNVTGWTDEMKTQWQEKMFSLGFRWPLKGDKVSHLYADSYTLYHDMEIAFSDEGALKYMPGYFTEMKWEDMQW